MTAVACLRVTVDRAPAGVTPAALVSLVAKLGSARLEAGWAWPRSHKVVSPFTFVLADPRVDQLDASELTTLAADLRRSLFGSEADGEVALMLFEGDPVEVARIAAATDESLEGILAGTEKPAFPGRIIRITPAGAVEIPADSAAAHLAQANFAAEGADTTEEEAEEPPPAAPDPGATASPEIGFWGVYFLVRERFIGSAVDWGAEGPPLTTPAPTSAIWRSSPSWGESRAARKTAISSRRWTSRRFCGRPSGTIIRPSSCGCSPRIG
jgi:hypothetical protein